MKERIDKLDFIKIKNPVVKDKVKKKRTQFTDWEENLGKIYI